MLLSAVAAGSCRARAPPAFWLRSAKQRVAAAPPGPASSPQWAALNYPRSASDCGAPALPRARDPGAVGALPRAVGREQQIIFSHVSVRCFSTSSDEQLEDGRLIYTGNLAKKVLDHLSCVMSNCAAKQACTELVAKVPSNICIGMGTLTVNQYWIGVRFFSYSTSMFSFCMMPYVIFKTGVGVESLFLQTAFYSIVGFFTFITPVTLHLLTKGYVVRLYYKAETDTYTAITYNAILAEKRTVFHQRDVKVPDISKMFTTFYAKTKSMLVNPMLFTHPQDYNHLMGYDKPFYFDLEEQKESSESK